MTATVRAALAAVRARGIAGLDAQLWLAHVLGTRRTALIADDDRPLALAEEQCWHDGLDQLAAGVPLAYLLGTKEFYGLELEVTPDVLVPRPETELLVPWAAALLATRPVRRGDAGDIEPDDFGSARALHLADLGTGSGAVALALKQLQPQIDVVATDCSAAALAVAARNSARLGLALELVEGDWWQALVGRRFDVVVANPPYIAAGDPHLPALRHEPLSALSPGGDGLDAIRTIVGGAAEHLEAGGWLLLEHGHDQGPAVRALLAGAGLGAIETRADLAGHERATAARRDPAAG